MTKHSGAGVGVALATAAFVVWGISPLFWRVLRAAPAYEIAVHRVVWSLLCLLPALAFAGPRAEVVEILRRPARLALLGLTSCLVAANWFIYIWAVTHDRVVEASLGYYINPLVSVLLGVVFLGERLRPRQRLAVVLAFVAVVVLSVRAGAPPWVGLGLAGTFGLYGLLRKRATAGPVVGLLVETLLLGLPGAVGLLLLHACGGGAFLRLSWTTDALLVLAGPLTAIPLLCFHAGVKRLRLVTVGLMQYIAPTLMLLLGACVFGEPVSALTLAAFGLVWSGLGLYAADALRQ